MFLSLVCGLIFSSIGIWMIRESKKSTNVNTGIIGIVLLLFTYATPNVWWDLGIGSGLCFLAWYLW